MHKQVQIIENIAIHKLIGFDRRIAPSDATSWSSSRRENYLIRTDILHPMSVDPMVWSSVFDLSDALQRPGWIGPNNPLWSHVSEMQSLLQTPLGTEIPQSKCIAVTKVADFSQPNDLIANNSVCTRDGLQLKLLGYDVADDGLLSGLSNCGFLPDDDKVLFRSEWEPCITDNHLLCDITCARRFVDVSDRRVQEHAPFSVFALWEVVGLE